MIELGAFEWGMLVLDILLIVGFAWSLQWAKKMNYPYLYKDARVPAILITIFTVVLLLYITGVWT